MSNENCNWGQAKIAIFEMNILDEETYITLKEFLRKRGCLKV